MNKKKILNIALGIIIIVVAALIFLSMNQPDESQYQEQAQSQAPSRSAPEQEEFVGLVVARRDIPKGSIISSDIIKQKKAAARSLTDQDIVNPDAVVGKVATIDIILGEKITRSKIVMRPGEQQLSTKIPEGKRAITIPIDKISSLEGMIKPGDRVDIVGMFPYTNYTPDGQPFTENIVVTMFEHVLVLAVGSNISGYSAQQNPAYSSMTFALSQEESSLFIYSLQLGTIRLLLRSPYDAAISKTKIAITMQKLQQKLFNVQELQQSSRPPADNSAAVASEPRPGAPTGSSSSEIEVFTGGQSNKSK